MKRKLLSILMAGLILGLSACSLAEQNTKETDNTESVSKESETEESEEETETKESEEDTDVSEEPDTEAPKEDTDVSEEPDTEAPEEVTDASKVDCFKEPGGDYIHRLSEKTDEKCFAIVDLYDDGTDDYIVVTPRYFEDSWSIENYEITVNNATYVLDEACSYFGSVFLVKSGEKYYLYLQLSYDNDGRWIDILEITQDSVKYVGGESGELEPSTDSKDFKIRKYVNMLMSFHAEADCYVGADGMPVPCKGTYVVDNSEWNYGYTSLVDIPAELVDEQGNLLGTTYTFPAGTEFLFMTTDLETYVDAKTSDGKYCRLYTTPAEECDYQPTVNGLDAETCFGNLGFAG